MKTLCLLALCAAAPALAQPTTQAPASQRVSHVDFLTAEKVDGATQNPDGVIEEGRLPELLDSLVRVRPDFRAELLQSAEEL